MITIQIKKKYKQKKIFLYGSLFSIYIYAMLFHSITKKTKNIFVRNKRTETSLLLRNHHYYYLSLFISII